MNLPAGGSVTYTAPCTISPLATGTLSNTATVSAPGGVTDPNPGNNSATDSDTLQAGASLSGTKTVSGTFTVGGTVTYTVVLDNAGPGAQGDNPGNEFTDILPPQVALVSANATSGTVVANIGTNTVTWNGSIAALASVTITITITITATVQPATPGTMVSNQGSVSYDSDGNGTNDATVETDDPTVAAPANPTTFTVAAMTANVPMVAPWGLLLMSVLIGGGALLLLRKP